MARGTPFFEARKYFLELAQILNATRTKTQFPLSIMAQAPEKLSCIMRFTGTRTAKHKDIRLGHESL
ncbi:hypothetical protein WT74_00030 [Burkholderia stagnalis]|nr:hypothetical protein WT74_00030 [Burkholderia stagnalis]